MYEPQQEAQDVVSERVETPVESGGRSVLGAIGEAMVGIVYSAAMLGASLWEAATSDGMLAAAGRQGIDELGKALEAFPQSLHSSEVGTIFSPTQGEVASERSEHSSGGLFHSSYYASFSHSAGPPETWPSEIAKNSQAYDPGMDQGHDYSDGQSM